MRIVIPVMLAAAALAGCSVKQDDAAATANNTAFADTTPEGPSLAAKLFGGGKPMPLDIQQQGQNGTIVYLTSIQAKPTETVLAVKVVNGNKGDVQLNWADQHTFLAAGGQKFFVSPPVENRNLRVAEGATMDGELVFLGRLPTTGTVTLVFNDGMSDSQYSTTPGISIPIQITSAAYSDDGSKKNLAA